MEDLTPEELREIEEQFLINSIDENQDEVNIDESQ